MEEARQIKGKTRSIKIETKLSILAKLGVNWSLVVSWNPDWPMSWAEVKEEFKAIAEGEPKGMVQQLLNGEVIVTNSKTYTKLIAIADMFSNGPAIAYNSDALKASIASLNKKRSIDSRHREKEFDHWVKFAWCFYQGFEKTLRIRDIRIEEAFFLVAVYMHEKQVEYKGSSLRFGVDPKVMKEAFYFVSGARYNGIVKRLKKNLYLEEIGGKLKLTGKGMMLVGEAVKKGVMSYEP